MKKLKIIIATSIFMASSPFAADIVAGKAKSLMCTECHGEEGIATNARYPNLAGQNARYTATQLKYYKSGSRKDREMASIVMNLSDTDIANLAAYYSSLK